MSVFFFLGCVWGGGGLQSLTSLYGTEVERLFGVFRNDVYFNVLLVLKVLL